MGDEQQYKKSLMLLEETRYSEKTETLYGGPRQRALVEMLPWGVRLYVHQETMDFLKEHRDIALVNVRCEECAHKREENGVLRCPYSTVDLDPNGYCHRGEAKRGDDHHDD